LGLSTRKNFLNYKPETRCSVKYLLYIAFLKMSQTIHINLFHFQADHDEPFMVLTATSERLTSMGVIPRKGERIVVQQNDDRWLADRPAPSEVGPLSAVLAKSESAGAIRRMVTVTEVIYDFLLSDVGIICEDQPV
jgi:hypothetical protein